MSDAQKAPYVKMSADSIAERKARRKAGHETEGKPMQTLHADTPWGLGDQYFPLRPEHVQNLDPQNTGHAAWTAYIGTSVNPVPKCPTENRQLCGNVLEEGLCFNDLPPALQSQFETHRHALRIHCKHARTECVDPDFAGRSELPLLSIGDGVEDVLRLVIFTRESRPNWHLMLKCFGPSAEVREMGIGSIVKLRLTIDALETDGVRALSLARKLGDTAATVRLWKYIWVSTDTLEIVQIQDLGNEIVAMHEEAQESRKLLEMVKSLSKPARPTAKRKRSHAAPRSNKKANLQSIYIQSNRICPFSLAQESNTRSKLKTELHHLTLHLNAT